MYKLVSLVPFLVIFQLIPMDSTINKTDQYNEMIKKILEYEPLLEKCKTLAEDYNKQFKSISNQVINHDHESDKLDIAALNALNDQLKNCGRKRTEAQLAVNDYEAKLRKLKLDEKLFDKR